MKCKYRKCSKKCTVWTAVPSLLLLIVATVCIVLLFPWSKYGNRFKSSSIFGYLLQNTDKGCIDHDCKKAMNKMRDWMNVKAEPCEDFFQYSCGGFAQQHHSFMHGRPHFTKDDFLQRLIDQQIKRILEEPSSADDSDSLNKTRDVYRVCIRADSSPSENPERVLLSILSQVGSWPFLQPKWKDCRPDLEWRMAALAARGVHALYRVDLKIPPGHLTPHIVMSLDEPLVKEICDDDNETASSVLETSQAMAHRDFLKKVLTDLKVDVSSNKTEKDLDELLEFDYMFCNTTKISRQKRKSEESIKTNTLADLASIVSEINWMRWRNLFLEELGLPAGDKKYSIQVEGLDSSLEALNDLLREASPRVKANYLTWKFVYRYLSLLGTDFSNMAASYEKFSDVPEDSLRMRHYYERELNCAYFVRELMPMTLLKAFYETFHGVNTQRQNAFIALSVKKELKDMIKGLLSSADLTKSNEKIEKIQLDIGYPIERNIKNMLHLTSFPTNMSQTSVDVLLHNYKKLNASADKKCKNESTKKWVLKHSGLYVKNEFYDEFYSGLVPLKDRSFVDVGMKLMIFRKRHQMKGILKNTTILDMEFALQILFSPFDINSFNFFRNDSIIMTLGLIHSQIYPFTSTSIPKFKSFSTLGWIIGREISRGFDINSLNVSSTTEWISSSPVLSERAETRFKCFRKYFSDSADDNQYKATNEDYLDHQGIFLAYKAYLQTQKKNDTKENSYVDNFPDKSSLNITREKLFFLSFAQQFCEMWKTGDEGQESDHPTGRERVHSILRNLPSFAEAFHCLPHHSINSHKCSLIWH